MEGAIDTSTPRTLNHSRFVNAASSSSRIVTGQIDQEIDELNANGAEAYVAQLSADILKSLLGAENSSASMSDVDVSAKSDPEDDWDLVDDSLVEDLDGNSAVHDIAIVAQAAMGLDVFGKPLAVGSAASYLERVISRLAQTPPYGRHIPYNSPLPAPIPAPPRRITNHPSFEPIITIDANGQKRFKCPQCYKSFARAYNLSTHLSTHDPDPVRAKPYFCTFPSCLNNGGRHFSRKHDLQRHITSTHEGETVTSADFATLSAQALVKIDDSSGNSPIGKKFRCQICNRTFIRRDVYVKHKCGEVSSAKEASQTEPPFVLMGHTRSARSSGSPAVAERFALSLSDSAYEEAAQALVAQNFAVATNIANRESQRAARELAAYEARSRYRSRSRDEATQREANLVASSDVEIKSEPGELGNAHLESDIDLNSHIANLMKEAGVEALLDQIDTADTTMQPETVNDQVQMEQDPSANTGQEGDRKTLVMTEEEKRRAMEVLQLAMLGRSDSDSDSASDSDSDSGDSD